MKRVWLVGIVVLGLLLLILVQTSLRAATGGAAFLPIIRNQFQSPLPNKVAYIIQERIAQVEAALAAAPGPTLSMETAVALSDELIKVNESGDMRLGFHSAAAIGAAEINALTARGATIEMSSADLTWPVAGQSPAGFGLIVAWMPHDHVQAAADTLAWVTAVTTVEENPPDTGTFLSEGVALHSADDAQGFGLDGAGITIGAISDGINNLAASQALGDLPATVTVPATCGSAGGDEGTAMLEIIHDMVPASGLQFCATGGGVLAHVNAQNSLVAGGVDIIAEDIPFDSEPAFQQGIATVNGDAIAAAGVSMHSSAGNRGAQHAARVPATGSGGGPDGTAGPYAGCPLTPDNVVAIAPGGDTTFDVTMSPGTGGTSLQVTLQWSEPRAVFPTAGAGGFTDLNLYVMNAALTACLGSSISGQANGAGDTLEQVVVNFAAGPNVPIKIVVDVENVTGAVAAPTLDLRWRGGTAGGDATTRGGSLNPDANYTGLATSAAAAFAGGSTDPTTVGLEGFSSGGPVLLRLTTVCPGNVYPCPGGGVAGPADVTTGAPQWTAADGVSISGVGGFGSGTCPAVNQGDCRFFGTSASAPHAAACDALVRQNMGALATVTAVNGRLAAAAVDRGPAGPDNAWGAGVLDCLRAAVQADLSLVKSDSPDPVAAGTNLTYLLTVTNLGPDASPVITVTDTLPGGVSFVSSPDGCAETAPGSGVVVCTGLNLASGASQPFTLVTAVAPDLVYNAGGPTTVTNAATVSGIGLDPDPANNDASEDTLVVAEADLEILSFDAVDPPVEILMGQEITITLRKEITNHGPSAPVDVEVTQTAVAPPGSTVSPTLAVFPEWGLGLGEIRVVTETFTINCGQPGDQVFTFGNEIQPLDPADTDPDQSNNTASVDVTVNCVIPVAVNIKPGSYPNSVNPRNNGVIPLAVLTTMAGEYDTVIDVDATQIDPLSTRFGPWSEVWNETGGAAEAHNQGHIEDAYELDEVTLDGDDDMVLHYRTQETGIEFGDTEACIKGELVDDGGNVYTFFGCDSIWTPPGGQL